MKTDTAVILTVTYHDPDGSIVEQIKRVWPTLSEIFPRRAVRASYKANAHGIELLAASGARVEQERAPIGRLVGRARRRALELALQAQGDFMLYCDCDRVLHWAERYPDELTRVATQVREHDLTVLGRTPAAFASHPRVQRDTEAIVNHVFSMVSGQDWDVTAAARGLSRRAAESILAHCPDEEFSTDVSWPLYLLRAGGFSTGYLTTEGLEFETGDRHGADIAAAGGYERWLAQLDSDPARWAMRLELARIEVEGLLAQRDRSGRQEAGGDQ